MDQVFPIVYRELKTIAQRLLARGGSATVTPTVLVHELYGKLHGAEQLSVEGRAHFFALCARVMKQIIVDHARQKSADKRSAQGPMLDLSDIDAVELGAPENVLAIEVALRQLQAEERTTVLLVEQNVGMAVTLGDHVAVMDGGRIVHAGPMAALAADEAMQQRLLGLSLEAHA